MSDSGQICHGPANWFTLRCPDTLAFEITDTFLEFRPAESGTPEGDPSVLQLGRSSSAAFHDWNMTLYSAWVDPDAPESRATSFGPEILFPDVVSMEPSVPLSLPGTIQSTRGTSHRQPKDVWWKRLLKTSATYHWQLWVIEYQQIIVVASLQSAVGKKLSTDTISTCASVLNTISFADTLAMPPDVFRKAVLELAEKHFPLLDIRPAAAFSIDVAGSELNLANFYRSYIRQPDQFRQLILPGIATVVRMQEWSPEQLMPPFDAARDRVMPMLYPEDEATSAMAEFVQQDWVGGLKVLFVLDEADSYRFVHQRMLDDWKISVQELFETAMKNLDDFSETHPLEVNVIGEPEDPGMLVPSQPDAYNTSRLLTRHLHGRLRELLGSEVIVGAPNRDFFVAVSLRHAHLLNQVREQVRKDYQSMHHPLTTRLLVISADGVSEYCDT